MELLNALAQWPGAELLRGSSLAYLLTNAAHIFAIALLLGSVITLDLRLLGVFADQPLAPLNHVLGRMGIAGFVLAMLTGAALFSVRPGEYAQNPAFLAKLALVALAVLNFAVLMRRPDRPAAHAVRLSALVSLVLWTAALVAGRWIGFV